MTTINSLSFLSSQLRTVISNHRLPLAFTTALVVGSLTSVPSLNQYKQLTPAQKDLAGVGGALVIAGLFASVRQKPTKDAVTVAVPTLETARYTNAPLTELAINAAKYPHVMIVGKTGGGKSTLAQYLASQCPGKRFAIAPHLDLTTSDWQCCHAIFGTGRNYGSDTDESISYADLVAGSVSSPTCVQVLKAIVSELDARYRSPLPQDSHPVHNWLIDESPAVARALDKLFGAMLAPVLFEARKIGLRLFILTQSDNVETLKIKGQGKLRDQFTYIYLGDSAKARLRSLKRRLPALEPGVRWCVVDETVALVPDVTDIAEATREAVVPQRFIAALPDVETELPKPSQLAKREPTPGEWELLAAMANSALVDNPAATDAQLATALGFSGAYYKRGKQLVAELRSQL